MPDTKISDLASISSFGVADSLGVARAGTSFRATREQLFAGANVSSFLDFESVADPPLPAASTLRIYSKDIAGRIMPKWKGPSGLDIVFQPALFGNNVNMWTPTTSAPGLWLGTAGAGAGIHAVSSFTSTNLYTALRRSTYANVSTTTNQVLGVRNTEPLYTRGGAANIGGFFFFARFGFNRITNSSRVYVGMAPNTGCVSSQPTTQGNLIGFCAEQGDTSFFFLTTGSTAATTSTKVAIPGGPAVTTNQGYDAFIWCAPNNSKVYYRLDNLNLQSTMVNTSTDATLPLNTTTFTANCLASNGNATLSSAVSTTIIGINRIYVEVDY